MRTTDNLVVSLNRELHDLRTNVSDIDEFCRKLILRVANLEAENEDLRQELSEVRGNLNEYVPDEDTK